MRQPVRASKAGIRRSRVVAQVASQDQQMREAEARWEAQVSTAFSLVHCELQTLVIQVVKMEGLCRFVRELSRT